GVSRQEFLRLLGAAIVATLLGPAPPAAAVRRRRVCRPPCACGRTCRRGRCVPPRACSQGECSDSFSDECDRDFCEFICNQCRGGNKFCIVENEPSPGDKVARCCQASEVCKGGTCCPGVRACGGESKCCASDEICSGLLRKCCKASRLCGMTRE